MREQRRRARALFTSRALFTFSPDATAQTKQDSLSVAREKMQAVKNVAAAEDESCKRATHGGRSLRLDLSSVKPHDDDGVPNEGSPLKCLTPGSVSSSVFFSAVPDAEDEDSEANSPREWTEVSGGAAPVGAAAPLPPDVSTDPVGVHTQRNGCGGPSYTGNGSSMLVMPRAWQWDEEHGVDEALGVSAEGGLGTGGEEIEVDRTEPTPPGTLPWGAGPDDEDDAGAEPASQHTWLGVAAPPHPPSTQREDGVCAAPHVLSSSRSTPPPLARYPHTTRSSEEDDEGEARQCSLADCVRGEGEEDGAPPLSTPRRHHAARGVVAVCPVRRESIRVCCDEAAGGGARLWTSRTGDPTSSSSTTGGLPEAPPPPQDDRGEVRDATPAAGAVDAARGAGRRPSVFLVVAAALGLRRSSAVRASPPAPPPSPHAARKQSVLGALMLARRASAPAGRTAPPLPVELAVPRRRSVPGSSAALSRRSHASRWAGQGGGEDVAGGARGEHARLAALPRYSPRNPFVGLASLVRTASGAASFYRSARAQGGAGDKR